MSTVFDNDLPARLGFHPGQPQAKPREEEGLDYNLVMAATLHRIEYELRRARAALPLFGRQQVREDASNAVGGLCTFKVEGPKSGADWFVERVSIQAEGASAAGTVAIYDTEGPAANTPPQRAPIDFLGALTGNTPSRGKMEPTGSTGYFIYGGQPLLVYVAAVVAATTVELRVQFREVLGNDPLLINDYTPDLG